MKNIVQSVFLLLMLQLTGEVLHRLLRLPVPGPVLGMIILAAYQPNIQGQTILTC
jgi:holin-like protein